MVRVMLDAGHSYSTPGKGVPTMKEYEFNRKVASYISQELSKYKDVSVSYSYSDTRDVPLKERTDLANKMGMDAFVSLHADAFSNKDAKGETVFIYPRAGASTLSLANAINEQLKAESSISNRGVKRADFHVLRETTMDAVLIEFGFMSNDTDLALLKSDTYRRKCAQMVVAGLVKYFNLQLKEQPKPAPTYKLDTVPVKSPHTYRLAKFIDTTNPKLIEQLKIEGYRIIDLPK